MRVLVSAASKHGAAAEIAAAIAEGLCGVGVDAEFEFDGYDAAVPGSAVYAGRWLSPARKLEISTTLTGER